MGTPAGHFPPEVMTGSPLPASVMSRKLLPSWPMYWCIIDMLLNAARRLLRLRIFLGLLLELVHESMVLHFHLLSIAGAAFDGVLHHRLAFELLRPARHGH